jgi:hypothetical protein
MLAIDSFVLGEMKKLFSSNPITKKHISEINWDNYSWLKGEERIYLLTLAIGKKPSVKKQKNTLKQVNLLSRKVPQMANGKL